jgi:putative ABC transport system permease protein
MFDNYLKSALRFLNQNKVFVVINAVCLSIALAASFIILLFVINELSYDHCHKKRERIFRVLNFDINSNTTMSGTPYILASALREEFPQIEHSINLRPIIGFRLKLKDEYIKISNAIATDSEVFDIFSIQFIGNTQYTNILNDQNSLVLSIEMAKKFFPGQNPIGKEILGIVNNKENIFVVQGVFENIPENSTFRAQCFLNSRWTLAPTNKTFRISNADKNWTINLWNTWVLLSKDCNIKSLENQFSAFEKKNISEKPIYNYSLQNLSDVYLGSKEVLNSGIKGNMNNILLFSSIAIFIMLITAFNYIILSTAVSSGRAKEIGIRKTFGAGNNYIKIQLLSESVLLAIFVFPVSLLLTWLAMPFAGKLFQTQLHIINANIVIYILVYLAITLLIGIISGLYTSTYLSNLKVINVFKNKPQRGKKKILFRSLLIVIQLIIFCTFVSATLLIHSQYQYALKKDLGYYNKNVLFIDLGQDFDGTSTFINNIRSKPNVIMAGGVMEELPMLGSMSSIYPNFQNNEIKVEVQGMGVDFNFLRTMGISVIEGRDYSEDFGGDLTGSSILNQTAVKRLGISDPIGKMIGNRVIIGIVKDFNLHSIHYEVPPLCINLTDRYIQQVAVHYKQGTLSTILPALMAEWKKFAPDRQFHCSTIEDIIKNLYSSEKNLTNTVSISALLTLLIAAFGLFGLTFYLAKTRNKEVGIKKVFGSSERSIVHSFLFENLVLVLISALLSVPITLYFINKWLNNFVYKVNITWWVFVLSFFIALIVVLLTVYFHTYKASRLDPVKVLRYE